MKATFALLVTGLASQQVAATWNLFDNFNTPYYSNNECSDKQKSGFDWSDLTNGETVSSYGDFSFSSGWKCSNSFGKRDLLTKRSFGSKCITNTITKSSAASFGCSKRGFSISTMDVSAQFDAELELHYKMQDGSICRQRSSCSAGGSTLQNTQCGGATSVEIYLAAHHQGSSSCEIGFHNIGFDCTTEKPYTTPSVPDVPKTTPSTIQSSTPEAATSTYPAETPATSIVETPVCYECEIESTPSVSTPAVSTPDVSTSSVSVPAIETPKTSIVSTPECHECEIESTPSVSTPAVSTPVIQTPVISTPVSVTTPAPFVNTTTTYPAQVTTVASTVITVPCHECDELTSLVTLPATSETPVAATSSAPPMPSTPSYPPLNVTEVVPKCLNSWLQVTAGECKDNTDSKCYCVKPEFTKQVIDCITARCHNDHDAGNALKYFIGICAEHVPQNPTIVGGCPPYIPLEPPKTPEVPQTPPQSPPQAPPQAPPSNYTPPAAPPATPQTSYAVPPTGETTPPPAQPPSGGYAPPPGSPSVPAATTVPVQTPVVEVPYTTVTCNTTTVTVPQVHFFTSPPAPGQTPDQPVALVPGPPPVSATTTGSGPIPYPSTMGTTVTTPTVIRPSAPPLFSGIASPLTVVPKGALFGAVLAFLAL